MLSPIAIATWISFCVPWAEPRLAAALIDAGSGGEPFVITDSAGKAFVAKNQAEAIHHLRNNSDPGERFLGLTQIPSSALAPLGLNPEHVLDKCTNLEVGYHLLTLAYEHAQKVEKSPWKTVSVAYSYYRNRQVLIDTPFARKATDHLMKAPIVQPAPMGSPLRHSIMAEWSAGLASRQGSLTRSPTLSALVESEALSQWARRQY
jgi:hypothetical protein